MIDVVLMFLVIVFVIVSVFQCNSLHTNVKNECLKSLRYYYILFSIFLLYTFLGCALSEVLKEYLVAESKSLELIAYLIPFIGLPFIVTAWYMLLNFAIEFTSIKIGRTFTYVFFSLNILFFLVYSLLCRYLYQDVHFTFSEISDHLVWVLLLYSSVIFFVFNFIFGYALVFRSIKSNVKQVSLMFFINVLLFLAGFAMFVGDVSSEFLLHLASVVTGVHLVMVLILRDFYKNEVVCVDNSVEIEGDIKSEACNGFYAHNSISTREREIVELICEGDTNKDIAAKLFITLQTVKDHTHRIYTKVGVKSRIQLVKELNNYKK